MKRIIAFVLLAGALCSCRQKGYTLEGRAERFAGAEVELVADGGAVLASTIADDSGLFRLNGSVEAPALAYLTIPKSRVRIPVCLQNNDYELSDADEAPDYEPVVISKTGKTTQDRYVGRMRKIGAIAADYHDMTRIEEDKNASVEERVERSQMFENKFRQWMDAVLDGVQEMNGSPMAYVIAADNMIFLEHDFALFSRFTKLLDENPVRTPLREEIYAAYEKLKAQQLTGMAPDFTLQDTEGRSVSLSSLRGSYVLLDFWASWCTPCRRKNKELNEMYPELHADGLEVVSVSLDEDLAAWKKAVAEDGISWLQLVDASGFGGSEVRKAYKFSQVPTVFLISPEGDVLATNPPTDLIKQYLE